MAHLYEGYSKDKLLKAFSHNQVKFEHSLVKGDTYSCESCGNEHTVMESGGAHEMIVTTTKKTVEIVVLVNSWVLNLNQYVYPGSPS